MNRRFVDFANAVAEGSGYPAVFAGAISHLFAGMGQEVFNAAILCIAVVMLTWHNVWMARHGSELAGELRAAGQAVVEGKKSLLALAVVVGVAVLREGSEVVLFLYGVLAASEDSSWSVALGGFLGLALGAAVCLLTYFGLLRIPTRALFTTTTVLIALPPSSQRFLVWGSSIASREMAAIFSTIGRGVLAGA